VLIVARGGGSLEDLWSFNDEIVVRAAAGSTIPLISAVGHETDWTLIDHAADVRAPTPTGAAEMAVPVRADLEAQLSGMAARLQSSMGRKMDYHAQGLRALVRALPSLDQLLALPRRRFDEASIGLGRGLEFNTLNKRRSFERVSSHLRPDVLTNGLLQQRQRIADRMQRADRVMERRLLQATTRITSSASALRSIPARLLSQLERQKERVESSMRRADTSIVNRMSHKRSGIAAHDRILQSLSYKNVLKRGYAVIRDEHNKPLTRAANVATGQSMSIEFADGAVSAVAGEAGAISSAPAPVAQVEAAPAPKKKPAKPEGQGGSNQGSLF
jgi:exodeoxyribonuclease VII large subunit